MMEYLRATKKTCSTACRGALQYVDIPGRRPPVRSIPAGEKWCTKCESTKPVTDFYEVTGRGYAAYCKPCVQAYNGVTKRRQRGLPDDAVLPRGRGAYPIGHTRYDSKGYVYEKVGDGREAHHRADAYGWVFQHVLVAEKKYGVEITREYTVHHKNGKRDDNRPANLELRAGPHGKGADILPFALRTKKGRLLAADILEEHGYRVTRPADEPGRRA